MEVAGAGGGGLGAWKRGPAGALGHPRPQHLPCLFNLHLHCSRPPPSKPGHYRAGGLGRGLGVAGGVGRGPCRSEWYWAGLLGSKRDRAGALASKQAGRGPSQVGDLGGGLWEWAGYAGALESGRVRLRGMGLRSGRIGGGFQAHAGAEGVQEMGQVEVLVQSIPWAEAMRSRQAGRGLGVEWAGRLGPWRAGGQGWGRDGECSCRSQEIGGLKCYWPVSGRGEMSP